MEYIGAITQMLTALGVVVAAVLGFLNRRNLAKVTDTNKESAMHIEQLHLSVNSRMDQLLQTTRDLATQTGKDMERKNPTP